METCLAMDSKSKHLNLNIKKRFEHSSDSQLKVRGVLDTVTAKGQFEAGLHKFFRLGKLPTLKPNDVYQPDTRLRLGVGAKATSQSDDILFSVGAKKKVVLGQQTEALRTRINLVSYSQLTLAANYDYNVRSEKWSGEASAQASHARFGFTEGQDLRITAGYRAKFTQRGLTSTEPYLRVQENAWGIQMTFKEGGRHEWLITYDL